MSEYNTIKMFLSQGYNIEWLSDKFPQIGKNKLYKYLKIYNLEKFNNEPKNILYHSAEWKALKSQVIARDGRKCCICGKIKNLQLDHIISKTLRPDLIADLNNLRLLCINCHKKTKTFGCTGIKDTIKNMDKLIKTLKQH